MMMLAWAWLGSCAAQRVASVDPLGDVPEDFGVEISIMVDPPDVAADASLQPSRYVLMSDGLLYYGFDEVGGQPGRIWMPPPVRVLTRAQVAEVWSLARQLGFADANAGDAPSNFRLVDPPQNEALYLMRLSSHERRWDFIQRMPVEQVPQSAMHVFVRHLAQLAWVDERPPQERPVAPKRYDFGPDPYERYRSSNDSK
jgi:hypothetical protein